AAMGDDGTVSEWLSRHGLEEKPRLADRLQVQNGWEKAVEMVLGDALHGLCVDGLDQVEQWLGDLQNGHVCLLTAATAGQAGSKGRPLSSLVSGQVPALLQD